MIAASQNWKSLLAMRALAPVEVVTIDGYSRVLTTYPIGVGGEAPWIKDIASLQQEAQVVQGASTLSDLTVAVNDQNHQITADRAGFTFEGKTATIKTGFRGLALGDYLTVATMLINKVQTDLDNTVYLFNLTDFSRLLQRTVYRTGDDGRPTSNNDPKIVSGNPMDILLEILQTQLSLAPERINSTAINAYKNGLFAGMKLRFEMTTAPQAKDWLDKELFQALGGYGFWNNAGAFTPYFYIPQAVPTVALALTEYNVEGVPVLDQADPMNFITYRLDYQADEAQQELTELYGPSFNLYGMQSQHIIEARGVRSFYQGLTWARLLAHTLFRRYAMKPPLVTATAFWDAAVLDIGDCVTLTHSKMVPPGGGTLGVTNQLFEVVKISKDFTKRTVELGLLDVNWLNGVAAYFVAPDAQLDWTLASPTEKATYMFLASLATGNYSDGTPGHLIY